ncbi:MAG: helix-turn-helix domain-containing protein [Candidatus Brocadiaceae bacterium]
MNDSKILKINESGYMRVKDVAEYLNVPVSTIYNLTFRKVRLAYDSTKGQFL